MKIKFKSLDISDTAVLSREFIEKHMVKVNGEYVKVYLHLCIRAGEELCIDSIAEALCLTEKDVVRAIRYWKKQGLIFEESPCAEGKACLMRQEEFAPEEAAGEEDRQKREEEISEEKRECVLPSEIPDKSEVDLTRLEEDKEFKDLVYCAQTYLAKTFTPTDIRTMAYMYDVLRLPTELIEYLIEICVQKEKRSLRYIEAIAIDWKSKNICSIEQAKEDSKLFRKSTHAVSKAFGLGNRSLGSREEEYIEKWSKQWGFSSELIVLACERTLAATQKPSFQYADSILSNWRKEGAYDTQKIKELDAQRQDKIKTIPLVQQKAQRGTNKFHNFEQRDDDLDSMVLDRLSLQLNQNRS